MTEYRNVLTVIVPLVNMTDFFYDSATHMVGGEGGTVEKKKIDQVKSGVTEF
jgi:hypothetical protein